jgi:hypothetical protein
MLASRDGSGTTFLDEENMNDFVLTSLIFHAVRNYDCELVVYMSASGHTYLTLASTCKTYPLPRLQIKENIFLTSPYLTASLHFFLLTRLEAILIHL